MLNPDFEVAGRRIGPGHAPYVIAEAGSNHNQSLDTARRLIDVATDAGCDAVKFQLFDTDALYSPGHKLYPVFKSVELSPDWLKPLQQHCEGRGIAFFVSVFDRRSTDHAAAIGVPAYKIASSETTNLGLLAAIAAKGKPLFVSTGMCDMVDVIEAVACCERSGNRNLALLQCVALYPPQPADANLAVMDRYRDLFECPVGYSDHVLGTTVAVAAAARGAHVIEKHFTLDRSSPGPDHFYAIEPGELAAMVRAIRDVHAAIGDGVKELHPAEREQGRRAGLYAAREIKAGERIAADAIATKSPAIGIRERYRTHVIGLFAARPISSGNAIQWEDLRP